MSVRDDGTTGKLPHGTGMLAELESYWRELRGARRLPVRTEVDPARIDGALPHAMILERVATGVARMRVAGEVVSTMAGVEARGLPLFMLFGTDSREALAHLLEPVFADPALVEIPLVIARSLWRPRVAGRLLILPLLGRAGLVDRALAVIVTDAASVPARRLFEIDPEGLARHQPLEMFEPIRLAHRMAATAGGRPTERQMHPASRAHLRLVVSNS